MDFDADTIARLEQTAASVLSLLDNPGRGSKRPLVIEFAGVPKSGKSTVAAKLELFLRRQGFKTYFVTERASVCPLNRKDHMLFNIWTSCITLAQILEHLEKDHDVILIDRGLFDAIAWMQWMADAGRLGDAEKTTVEQFLLLDRWRKNIDLVFAFSVTPKEALEREAHLLPTTKTGSVMNHHTLGLFCKALERSVRRMTKNFNRIEAKDTTNETPAQTIEFVVDTVLHVAQDLFDEQVLVIDLADLGDVQAGLTLDQKEFRRITKAIGDHGFFLRRSEAESRNDVVQPIPAAVLTHDSRVLLLRRKEADPKNRFHEKYVVWAGGHARDADKDGNEGDVLRTCLEREIDEELYIKSAVTWQPMAIAWDTSSEASRRHLGIMYVGELQDDNVALAMDQREFKERRGQSLSGTLMEPGTIVDSLGAKGIEPWSKMILSDVFGASSDEPEQGNLL